MTLLDSSVWAPAPTPSRRRFTVTVSVLVVLAVVAFVAVDRLWPHPTHVAVSGITDGALVGPSQLQEMAVRVAPDDVADAADITLAVDGAPTMLGSEGNEL